MLAPFKTKKEKQANLELKMFQNEVVHRLFYDDPSTKSNINLSPKNKRSKSTMRSPNISYEEFENRNADYGMRHNNNEESFSSYMDRLNNYQKFRCQY